MYIYHQDIKEEKKGGFVGNLLAIVCAVILALVIRAFWFEPFSIPSGSMIPTLEIGDYLFVSKPAYGYSRFSLPLSLPLIKDRIFYTAPERGDVVVFKLPSDNSTDYIKRVIGLPGDKIQVKEGRLYINDKIVPRKKIKDKGEKDSKGNSYMVTEYEETLPNGKVHIIQEIADDEQLDNTGVYEVPEGYFFMMGDNRDNSLDSRVQNVGYVPYQNLEGKAYRIFFSPAVNDWWKFWNWDTGIRWHRTWQKIE